VIFTQLHTLLENRRFASWLGDRGSGTYLDFLATHPRYVVTTPLTDRAVLDGFLQGTINTDVRHVLPGVVEDAVWPTRRGALLVALLCVALVVFVLSPSRRRRTFARSQGNARALAYAVFLFGLSAIAAFAFAHLVGAEFGRVLLLPALTLRLAVVIGGAALVDALHSPRHPDRLLSA